MAMKRQRGDHWEYTFKRAGVLEKPIYLTFSTEAEGDEYARKLEALLDRGIVPSEHQSSSRVLTIAELVRQYLREAHISDKDANILVALAKPGALGKVSLAGVDANWVDGWIADMKRVNKLAPATIRSKVGALARCTDWGMRKKLLLMPDHPLRTLRDGYAQYTELDGSLAKVTRVDVERDRRLEKGEYEKILATIDAGVLPRVQRPLVLAYKAALGCMVTLAVETAMRMREMYTLTTDQVDLPRRTVFLDKTKNGDKRQVPLSSVALATLMGYLEAREIPEGHPADALFPWWDGTAHAASLARLSDFLSKQFIGIFEASGCVDLKFHDLRHEATSRLFERTTLSDTQIMKITGHKTQRMLMRYSNLRASDLADKLW